MRCNQKHRSNPLVAARARQLISSLPVNGSPANSAGANCKTRCCPTVRTLLSGSSATIRMRASVLRPLCVPRCGARRVHGGAQLGLARAELGLQRLDALGHLGTVLEQLLGVLLELGRVGAQVVVEALRLLERRLAHRQLAQLLSLLAVGRLERVDVVLERLVLHVEEGLDLLLQVGHVVLTREEELVALGQVLDEHLHKRHTTFQTDVSGLNVETL
eukprot:6174167-Pleurochrysis_carterae.AAC.1